MIQAIEYDKSNDASKVRLTDFRRCAKTDAGFDDYFAPEGTPVDRQRIAGSKKVVQDFNVVRPGFAV